MMDNLTSFEKKVHEYIDRNLPISEIARKLHCNESRISQSYAKIKRKLEYKGRK